MSSMTGCAFGRRISVAERRLDGQAARFGLIYRHSDALAPCLFLADGSGGAVHTRPSLNGLIRGYCMRWGFTPRYIEVVDGVGRLRRLLRLRRRGRRTRRRLCGRRRVPERTRYRTRLSMAASVLEGVGRAEAGRTGGMGRRAVRDWLRRYDAEGPEGLRDRPRGGDSVFSRRCAVGGCAGLGGVGSGRGARRRGSVARSRHSPEDRGGHRRGRRAGKRRHCRAGLGGMARTCARTAAPGPVGVRRRSRNSPAPPYPPPRSTAQPPWGAAEPEEAIYCFTSDGVPVGKAVPVGAPRSLRGLATGVKSMFFLRAERYAADITSLPSALGRAAGGRR